MLDRDNFKAVAAALTIMGAALLACSIFPSKAHAQLGASAVITVPGSVTSDQPTEQSTLDMDTVQLPAILANLSTGERIGNFTQSSGAGFLGGVTPNNFDQLFPGWQPLPNNSTPVAEAITNASLQTYLNALAVAEGTDAGDTRQAIETTSTNTTNMLTALQANTDAVLEVARQQQITNQLLAALVSVASTKAAEELNERAQEEATSQQSYTPVNVGPQ